ncbi:hypothetical protein AwWohl_08440 [Gammaproteobacteria bacterium]|nr:hypothetical protein AwWohl_08440 [Gammaproteobacteria bacterium]
MAAQSTQELIIQAKDNTRGAQYKTAISYYDTLEARLPMGSIAEEAKLAKIYIYYKDREPEKAIAEADLFLKTYPNHAYADYAWYMKGMIDYDRALSIIDKLLPPDRSRINPAQMKRSLIAFETVVKNYPNGEYAEESLQRAIFLRNNLSKSEMNVADFYMRRKAYIAAANRAQNVLDLYDGTPSTVDALYLQVKAYRELKLDVLANDRLRILQLNFPRDPRLSKL